MRQNGLLRPLSTAELSDGTLRYLLLVAALTTPQPPCLMVLNEPETSLHPSLLAPLSRLIIRACDRSQLLVVSHAQELVSQLDAEGEALMPRKATKYAKKKRLNVTDIASLHVITIVGPFEDREVADVSFPADFALVCRDEYADTRGRAHANYTDDLARIKRISIFPTRHQFRQVHPWMLLNLFENVLLRGCDPCGFAFASAISWVLMSDKGA